MPRSTVERVLLFMLIMLKKDNTTKRNGEIKRNETYHYKMRTLICKSAALQTTRKIHALFY